jgi:protein-S-isoprenylcysteine O-methyltransferase Ste14
VIALAAFVILYIAVVRPWHLRWGATPDEAARGLPGDNLVPEPLEASTRAITINAWPSHVWPWLAQLGKGRGGLYSYDWLDRLFGVLDAASADTLIPAFQQLRAGDTIPVGGSPGWPVAIAKPNELLLLDVHQAGAHVTWAFALVPISPTETRLIMRVRARLPSGWRLPLLWAVLDPAEFLMVRRQLIGIRDRAERLARADPAYARRAARPVSAPDGRALISPVGADGPILDRQRSAPRRAADAQAATRPGDSMIWLRALSFVLLVQFTVVGLIPWWLSRLGPHWPLGSWRLLGIVPLAAGLSLLLTSNVLFVRQGHGTAAPYDPPRALVLRGPYRHIRNPMYLSAILIVVGSGLWLGALSVLVYAAALAGAYELFVRYYEEPRLTGVFGTAYRDYVARVPRWWPRPRGVRGRGPGPGEPTGKRRQETD